MGASCKYCRFSHVDKVINKMVCRYNPPVIINNANAHAQYPKIEPDWWCGKYDRQLCKGKCK